MTILKKESLTTFVDTTDAVKHQRALVDRFRQEARILAREVGDQRAAVKRQTGRINRAIESVMLTKKMESFQLALRTYNRELEKLRAMGGLIKPERFVIHK